ncbi:MAG: GAF domain-containing protein, partial [Verrucomicrobia subdivision 3 bacterium]|nr:GAF domain-containing protein [Limisphaerales bacterium]
NIYYAGHPDTKSELAVRLEVDGRPLGVLNVEAFTPGWFDNQDETMLRLLAEYAAIAIRVLDEGSHLEGLFQEFAEESQPSKEVLTDVLQNLLELYALDGGIIFTAEPAARMLRCAAHRVNYPLDTKPEEFPYGFDDTALATWVFNKNEAAFVPNPIRDPRINPRRRKDFKIEGPVLALPLVFRDRKLGVLVVWGRPSSHLTQGHLDLLKPYALLAAATIARTQKASEQTLAREARIRALEEIHRMPSQVGVDLSEPKYVDLIFMGIQAAGLERARIFRYDAEGRKFVCTFSFGPTDTNTLRGSVVSCEQNPYARHTMETALADPAARMYDPTDPRWYGSCPDAEKLGKPLDLPWAAVPLIVDGALYGQITADNALSRQPLTGENLRYLTLLGQIISAEMPRKALRRSEALNQSLIDNMPVFLYRIDKLGRLTFVNKAFCRLRGSSNPEELIGKTAKDLYPPELAQKYEQDDASVFTTGKSIESDEQHRLPDGRQIFVHVVKTPLYDPVGNIVGIQGLFWDITPIKLAQDRAQELAHVGNWVWDIETDEVICSPEVYRIFGLRLDRKNICLRDLREMVYDGDQFLWDEAFTAICQGRQCLSRELRIQCPDGRTKWLYGKTDVIESDEADLPIKMIGIVQDITSLKWRQHTREELHDLASVIAKVGLVTESLKNGVGNQGELLGKLSKLAERGKDLIGSIRALIDEMKIADVDINNLVREVADEFQKLPERPLQCRLCTNALLLRLDEAKARRVLTNLLANAVEHGTPKTPIIVCTGLANPSELSRQQVVISVENDGDFLDEAYRSYLSQREFSRKGPGHGLGLLRTKALVEMQGGSLGFSRTPGRVRATVQFQSVSE